MLPDRLRFENKISPFALLLFCLVTFPAAQQIISLRADVWPPFNNAPADKDRPGYMIEIMKAIFEPKGYTIDYQTLPWKRAVEDVTNGKFDGAIGASNSDAPGCVFSEEPLGVMKNAFFVKKGNPWKYQGIPSLQSVRVGYIDGYAYDDAEIDAYLQAGKPPSVQVMSGDDALEKNIKKLLAGRIDAFIECEPVVQWTLRTQGVTAGDIVSTGQAGKVSDLFIAFSPKKETSRKYCQMITEGVRALRKSGELKKILARYGLSDWK